MKVKFPENFSFGAATSGPQSEGTYNKIDSIWEHWYKLEPNRFHNQVGPNLTCNTYMEYKKDVELMKECGLNSFRTSIQWSRIFNNPITLERNEEGIEFYKNYFKEINKANIDLYVNLFHFDLPAVLEDTFGGFLSIEVVELYAKYAQVCFELFDQYVDKWITFNEPIAFTNSAYIGGFIYPCNTGAQNVVTANNNILKAHMKAVKIYKENYNKEIGIVLDLLPPIIKDESDKLAQEVADLFINKIFLDPCIKLEYNPRYLEILSDNNMEIDTTTELVELDFVGINFYQPMFVKSPQKEPDVEEITHFKYFESYLPEGQRINEHRGWAIEPSVLYTIGKRMQEEYGNKKWFLSENGMGVEGEERFLVDGMIQDDYRTEFIQEHLYYLAKAVEEGSNCFGYHLWTFIDCFSWLNSYKNRYGLVSLNLETREKTLKKNAYFYRELAETKEFEADLEIKN